METKRYSLNITETEPQAIESKNFFLLVNNPIPISPKRSLMAVPQSQQISYNFPSNKNIFKDSKKESNCKNSLDSKKYISQSIEQKIDEKITENIKNRRDIEVLFNDPEIKIFLNENLNEEEDKEIN